MRASFSHFLSLSTREAGLCDRKEGGHSQDTENKKGGHRLPQAIYNRLKYNLF